jgi:hypothetical protein
MITFFKIFFIIHHSSVYFVGHLVCVITARGLRESYHPQAAPFTVRSTLDSKIFGTLMEWIGTEESLNLTVLNYSDYHDFFCVGVIILKTILITPIFEQGQPEQNT